MWVVCWVVLLRRAGLLILVCYRCVVLVSLYLLLILLRLFNSVVVVFLFVD